MLEPLNEPEDVTIAKEGVGVVDVAGGYRGSFGVKFVAENELFGEGEDEGPEDECGEGRAEGAALCDAFRLGEPVEDGVRYVPACVGFAV